MVPTFGVLVTRMVRPDSHTDSVGFGEGNSRLETVVVGLDGAGFDLLEPWLEAGELPNLERILETGVSGPLESVYPPVTAPNWICYATGKNPGQLGIFWWKNVDVENERVYFPRERFRAETEYWEYLAEDDPVGVLGVPTTTPPKPIDAFYVSGAPDADSSEFAAPQSVAETLRERFDYRINSEYRLEPGNEAACADALELIDQRFRAAKYLSLEHDVSFLQVSTFYINQFHHYLWDDEYTLRAWKLIDDHLGDFLAADCDLVLMSDHGHNQIQTVFRVNQWLEREGYLSWDRDVSETLYKFGILTEGIKRALAAANRTLPLPGETDLVSLAHRSAPQWLLKHLPDGSGEVGSRTTTNVEWDRTDAVASAQGPVYLTVDTDSPRYDALREEIRRGIEALTGPNGRPVADAVHYGEDVYSGQYVSEGPDLVIDQAEGVHIRESLGDKPVFSETDPKWRGVNKRHGLFAATGPRFGRGTVADLSILDLAPTLLTLHGRPVPTDMDGEVRSELFADEWCPPGPSVSQ